MELDIERMFNQTNLMEDNQVPNEPFFPVNPQETISPIQSQQGNNSSLKLLIVVIVIILIFSVVFLTISKKNLKNVIISQKNKAIPNMQTTHILPFLGKVVYIANNEIYTYTRGGMPHQFTFTHEKVNSVSVDRERGRIYFTLNAKASSLSQNDNALYSCDLGKQTCVPTVITKKFGWRINLISPDGNYIIGMFQSGQTSDYNTFVKLTTNQLGNIFNNATGDMQGCGVHITFLDDSLLGICQPPGISKSYFVGSTFAVNTSNLPIDFKKEIQVMQASKKPIDNHQVLIFGNEGESTTTDGQIFSYSTIAVFDQNALIHGLVFSSSAPDADTLANYIAYVPISFLNSIKTVDTIQTFMLSQSHPEFPFYDAGSINFGAFIAFTYNGTPSFAECGEDTCDIHNIATKQISHREMIVKQSLDSLNTLYIHKFNNDSLEIWQLLSKDPSYLSYENVFEVVDTKKKTISHAYIDNIFSGGLGNSALFPTSNEFLY